MDPQLPTPSHVPAAEPAHLSFVQTLVASIYNPTFYHSLPARPVGSSIKYFVLLALLVSVLGALLLMPGIFDLLSQANVQKLVNIYPNDLQVTLSRGQVSINQPEPYFIKNPYAGLDNTMPANLIVIDTKDPFSPEEFAKYGTEVLVTKDFIATKSSSQERMTPLSSFHDIVITKAMVQGWGTATYPYLVPVAIIGMVLVLIGFWIAHLLTLVYLLLAALIVWMMVTVTKTAGGYQTAYKVAVHAATLPVIFSTLLDLTHFQLPPFTFTVLMLVIAIVNLVNKPKNSLPFEQDVKAEIPSS